MDRLSRVRHRVTEQEDTLMRLSHRGSRVGDPARSGAMSGRSRRRRRIVGTGCGVVAALLVAGAVSAAAATWTDQHKLTAPTTGTNKELGNGMFGAGVALSSNATTALVGAPSDHAGLGAVWVFIRKGTTWVKQSELTAPTSGAGREIGNAGFGASVALSANGNTALIGGPTDNSNALGAVWVFVRTGSAWTEQDKLTGPVSGVVGWEVGGARFGTSVALSANGSTALIGGPGNVVFSGYKSDGAAWVFVRTGSTWTAQYRLTAPASGAGAETAGGHVGASVALSSNGNTALLGGPVDNPILSAQGINEGTRGAAWVFTRNGSAWTERDKLAAPTSGARKEIGGANLGLSVALSPNGTTALVGGPVNHGGIGAVWVFTRTGSTWTDQARLVAPTSGAGKQIGAPRFGSSVALASAGSIALIGGPDNHANLGAAWMFDYQPPFLHRAGYWAELQRLTAPTGGTDREIGKALFGDGVALDPAGTTALIGGPGDHASLGAAWVYAEHAPIIK